MFIIKPITEETVLKKLFEQNALAYQENCHAVASKENGQDAGFCLFQISDDTTQILYLSYPPQDTEMGDTLLRAALNYAANRNVYNAICSNSEYAQLLNALGFVENDNVYRAAIPEIFTQCKNCKNAQI